MNQALKPIPHFISEAQERDFWATHDMVEHMQEVTEPIQFRNLKPSTETISLRLPKSLLDRIRSEALKRDVPYQSYMKVKLSEIFGFRERVV
ncbi:MAG: BrnA antitoxin family protein [Anaerolineae bacterium]|nr:BrnA antitoxin family protein [Anaerolineae bacterium]